MVEEDKVLKSARAAVNSGYYSDEQWTLVQLQKRLRKQNETIRGCRKIFHQYLRKTKEVRLLCLSLEVENRNLKRFCETSAEIVLDDGNYPIHYKVNEFIHGLQEQISALSEWKRMLLEHPLGETVIELQIEVERLKEENEGLSVAADMLHLGIIGESDG